MTYKIDLTGVHLAPLRIALSRRHEDGAVEIQQTIGRVGDAHVRDAAVNVLASSDTSRRQRSNEEALVRAKTRALHDLVLELHAIGGPEVGIGRGNFGSSHLEGRNESVKTEFL